MLKRDEVGRWFKKYLGSCLSWAITVAWLIFIYFKIHNGILPTDLNEFGDFIAGAFAPLAFFWLVRGFYQQGKGLEQNSEALKLQATELEKTTKALELQVQEMKASVKQQSRLAKVYEEELQQKHFQVKPNLEYSFKQIANFTKNEPICDDEYEDRIIEFELVVKNVGETARNLLVKSINNTAYIRKFEITFQHLDVLTIEFDINGQCATSLNEEEGVLTFLLEISYQNVYGKGYEDHLTCGVESIFDNETEQIYLSTTLETLHTNKY
ncbi:hypothetical protein [Acinetobacter terrae]|uniref:hypothetical protein n=1 Tax=Acinetobacter terrae TaxID=2731247 RepID=UPI001D171D68|nr:hypothetical protein [Acinetobacter terrae]